MIVDLERRGERRMFITEQVAYIKANYSGGWTVRFATSPRFFQYNKARLLFLSDPEVIDLEEKGMYVNNKRIGDVAELLCFSTPQEKFYRVTHTNGFVECLDGRQVYVTRTPVDKIGGACGTICESWLTKRDYATRRGTIVWRRATLVWM